MSALMEIILLERVESLGNLGDRVSVKPGYARNYLLPQNKALRATKNNIAYFDARKKDIEKQNDANRKEAEKLAKNLEGTTVILVRLASESGQLYGSVTARDIADAICAQTKETIARNQVEMNQSYKMIGLFPVTLVLHPEVKIEVTVNIARSEEEAEIQGKTGKALVADSVQETVSTKEDAKETLLEESALEAEKAKAEEDAAKAAEQEEKARAKASKKAAKAEEEDASAEAEAEDSAEEES